MAGTVDAELLDAVVGRADAGGVDEAEEVAAEGDGVFDEVTGGALDVGDDGAIFFQEGVEEGGFADVRCADDGYGDAVLDGLTGLKAVGQTHDFGVNLAGEVDEAGAVGKLDVFFAEVEFEFEERGEFEELVVEGGELLADAAFHLLHGKAMGGGGLGGDEIGDGFGLGEVEAAVGEGAAGKLAWLCEATNEPLPGPPRRGEGMISIVVAK